MKNQRLIREKIEKIENRIKEVSQYAHFGDPVFSEWYESQVEEIEELQRKLDN